MSIYTRAAIAALLTGMSGASITVEPTAAGPLPISTTMEKATVAAAVEVRWSGRSRYGWGPRAPIDGAITAGPVAANAFGPYGYGYPYYPSYSCYGFWLFEECYARFHWGYRR
jgi:hypothetical protein